MKKSAIREKSIKGENWQLVKRKVVWCEIWNVPLLFLFSARWRRTGSMWLWSLTGYSSGCLYWCVYWDLLDSFFLLGWLEWSKNLIKENWVQEHWDTIMSHIVKKKEKVIYPFIFYFSKEPQVTLIALAPGYQKVTHRETRWNIYHWFQWAYKFFMRAKGQQRKYPSAPLHFDIELYSSSCHLHQKQWRIAFDPFTTVEKTTGKTYTLLWAGIVRYWYDCIRFGFNLNFNIPQQCQWYTAVSWLFSVRWWEDFLGRSCVSMCVCSGVMLFAVVTA